MKDWLCRTFTPWRGIGKVAGGEAVDRGSVDTDVGGSCGGDQRGHEQHGQKQPGRMKEMFQEMTSSSEV